MFDRGYGWYFPNHPPQPWAEQVHKPQNKNLTTPFAFGATCVQMISLCEVRIESWMLTLHSVNQIFLLNKKNALSETQPTQISRLCKYTNPVYLLSLSGKSKSSVDSQSPLLYVSYVRPLKEQIRSQFCGCYQQLEFQISTPRSKLLAKRIWEETMLGNFNNECIWRTKITKQESLLSHILGTKQITEFPVLVIKDHLKKHLTLVGEIPFSLKQM